MTAPALRLYGFPFADHAHRVALKLFLLDLSGTARLITGIAPAITDATPYPYATHAPNDGASLGASSLRAWFARIEASPGFVPMVRSPIKDAA